MHSLEHDNDNCSPDDDKLFLLDLNGSANWGRFSDLDSVHFIAVWESSSLPCSLSVLSWQLIKLKLLSPLV